MIPDGIYINMDMQAYREDLALGGHDLLEILTNAVQWYAKKRNTAWQELVRSHMTDAERKKADQEGASTVFGTALHTAWLEPDAFDDRYLVEPARPDWPDTIAEIENAILHAGHMPPKKSARRAEFVATARMHGIKTQDDWADELAVMSAGRIRINMRWCATLKLLQQVLERHSKAGKFLQNGLAEVSVFWTDENGVRLKCRFDYLTARTCADVKTALLRDGKEAIESFCDARDKYAYDFSAAHYMDCRVNVIPGLVERGAVYDATAANEEDFKSFRVTSFAVRDADYTFFQKVAAFEKPSWWWLCAHTGGYPEIDAVEFPTELMAFKSAEVQVMQARATYAQFRDKFGDDGGQPWVEDRGLVQLSEANFSPRYLDRGNRKYNLL